MEKKFTKFVQFFGESHCADKTTWPSWLVKRFAFSKIKSLRFKKNLIDSFEKKYSCFQDLALTTRPSGSEKSAKIEDFVELFSLVQLYRKNRRKAMTRVDSFLNKGAQLKEESFAFAFAFTLLEDKVQKYVTRAGLENIHGMNLRDFA